MINEDTRKEIYASQTSKVFLNLVTIKLEGVDDLHFVDDYTAITSNGVVFLPAGFDVSEPSKQEVDGVASLNFAGLTREHMELIQTTDTPITILISCIRADDPDILLLGPSEYLVKNININSTNGVIGMDLGTSGVIAYFASSKRFDVNNFPGLVG